MNRKNFYSALIFALALFVIISAGCGGGSSNNFVPYEPDTPTPSSPRYVLAGSLTDSRLNNSDLTQYLTGKITEKLDLTDIDGAISVIESLTSRDMIFFSDADKIFPERTADYFMKVSSMPIKTG